MGSWLRIRRVDWQVTPVLGQDTFELNSDYIAVRGAVES